MKPEHAEMLADVVESNDYHVRELAELELTYVGGGIGETSL